MPALTFLGGEPDLYTGGEFFPDSTHELCDDTKCGKCSAAFTAVSISVLI